MKNEHFEKLSTAATTLLEKLIIGLEKGVEAGAEKLPTIVEQYVTYSIAAAVAGTVLWTILIAIAIWLVVYSLRITTDPSNNDDTRGAHMVVVGVVGVFLAVNVVAYPISVWQNVLTITHAIYSPVTFMISELNNYRGCN